jgi:hypothetical protein
MTFPNGLSALIEHLGYATTATLYAMFDLACTAAIAIHWRQHLWKRDER